MVFVERLSSVERYSMGGGLCREVVLSREVHYGLRDWSLYRGGLCREVVSVERYTMGGGLCREVVSVERYTMG